MTHTLRNLGIVAAILWIVSQVATADVVNGDFEDPALAGWTVTPVSGNDVIDSGTASNLTPFSGATLAAFTGNSATMNGMGGILSQSVAVTPGQEHELRFYVGGRGNTTASLQTTLNVVDDNGGGATLVNSDLAAPPTIGTWQIRSFTFTPTTNNVMVSFQETSPNSNNRGPAWTWSR